METMRSPQNVLKLLMLATVISVPRLFYGQQTPPSGPQQQVDPIAQARSQLASGSSAASEATVRDYLKIHPDSADGHFFLGYLLFTGHRGKESLAEFTAGAAIRRPKADEIKIVASDYVLLGDLEDADKWFSEVTVEKPDDANAWYLLGRTEYNEGYYDKAVSSFEHALTLNPRNIEAENNLGLAYRESNNAGKAKAAFQLAIDWQGKLPIDAQPYLNIGTLLLDQGELDKAGPYLIKAVQLSPQNPKSHEELGTLYEASSELSKAESEFAQAVALAPETSALHFKLGGVYRKEGKKDLAQEQFKLCEKLNSTHSSKETPNSLLPEASKQQ